MINMKNFLLIVLLSLVCLPAMAQNVKTPDLPTLSTPIQPTDKILTSRGTNTGNLPASAFTATGTAGGDLTGTYPNPTIGTISNPGNIRGIPSNQWTGLSIFGDNGSYNFQIKPLNAGWGQIAANAMGVGPTYNVVQSSSVFDCDVVDQKIATITQPSSSNNIPNAWLPSVADPTFGAGTYQAHLADTLTCHLGGLTWLSVPVGYKIFGQSSLATAVGTWANSSYGSAYYGVTSQTQGDTWSAPITTNGGPIYLWYKMAGNDGGTFTYQLDGGAATTVATQGNNAFTFPIAGKTTLGAVRIPVGSSGPHTVLVTVTSTTSSSNTVTPMGVGTPPIIPYSSKFPVVVAGGQTWANNTYAAISVIFNNAYQTQAAQLLGDGLGVLFANTMNYFNFSTDVTSFFAGGTSLNGSGEKHIAEAFTGILQPIRSADGSVDPRDYGASCNSKFFQSNQGTGTSWILSATTSSPTVSLKSTGNVPYYFQPGTATQNGGGDVGRRACASTLIDGARNVMGPCSYIASVNLSNNTANMGLNATATVTSASSGVHTSLLMGGRALNPNDPSTAVDDSPFTAEAGQAAILGGGKVKMPTACMLHGAWPVANVQYEGNNAGLFYNQGNLSSDATPPIQATIIYCGMTGYQDDTQACADVSNAPFSKFKDIMFAGIGFPQLQQNLFNGIIVGAGISAVALGYSQSSNQLGPNTPIYLDNMSFDEFPVDVGEALGFNIQTTFTASITGNVLHVTSIDSNNLFNEYELGSLTIGNGIADMISLGRIITGAGVPANTVVTSVPQTGGAGDYGLSTASTVSSESMHTVQSANGMHLVDSNSEYFSSGFGINGDFTDSYISGSICTGTFMSYCWFNGPNSGASFGNGGNRWIGGRMEEIRFAAFGCDSCQAMFTGVDFDFNGGNNLRIFGTNSFVQQTGGWMVAGGHCFTGTQDKAMIRLGGTGTTISVDGVGLGNSDFGSGCGGSTTYLFSTSTGATLSNMVVSVNGGNTKGGFWGTITGLFNWANGTPATYKQNTVGWPIIDATQSALSVTSTGGVGIGTSAARAGTALDLGLTTSSMILPSGTTAQQPTGISGMMRYNTTLSAVMAYYGGVWNSLGSNPPLNYITGLALANDGTLPNTVIDIGVGQATSSDGSTMMTIALPYTKTTGSWTVGSGNGCLDTGAVANSTWYTVREIERTDTAVVDFLCTAGSAGPVIPTNYSKVRVIGFFKTDGSAHIIPFVQVGNDVQWVAPTFSVNTSLSDTSTHLVTLDVPPGVKVAPRCSYSITGNGNATLMFSPDTTPLSATITSPFAASPGYSFLASSTTGGPANSECPYVTTNTASQVVLENALSTTSTVAIITRGWKQDLTIPVGCNYNPPLDVYSGASAAYSFRALSTSWIGKNLVTLRRSSDNSTKTFQAFAPSCAINTSDPFFDASTYTVVTWFDQSGNGADAAQGTAANQPSVTLSCQNSRPCAVFDGTNDTMAATLAGAVGADTFAAVGAMPTTSGVSMISIGTGSNSTSIQYSAVSSGCTANRVVASTQYKGVKACISGTTYRMIATMNASLSSLYLNGVIGTDETSSASPAASTALCLGAQPGCAAGFLNGKISEMIVYGPDLSISNSNGVSSNQGTYWGL